MLSSSNRTQAENTRLLTENTRVVNSLAFRVDAVEQSQQALSAQHDADLAAVRADIARATTANQESINERTLEDSREIVVRGIPLAVVLEPLPLAAALLTALKLEQYVPSRLPHLPLNQQCDHVRSSIRYPPRLLAMTSSERHQA